MAKPHRCDVPGCTNTRRRWQRICEQCFADLPGDIRSGIIENHRINRRGQWKAFCRIAGAQIAKIKHAREARFRDAFPAPRRPTAAEAFDLTQRMMGERD